MCFTYNNQHKTLKVYVNSENVFEKQLKNKLGTFVIDKDFLQSQEFGKAGLFAGKFTDLNIWSRILNSSEIRDLYMCEVLDEGPNIVDWESSELVPGRTIVVMEKTTHPCKEHHQLETETMIYDVKIGMEPDRKVLRVCGALGGTMKPPSSMKDLEKIKKNLNMTLKEFHSWVPIFKTGKEEWVDEKHEVASFTPWVEGQPNGGIYEECTEVRFWFQKFGYFDTPCSNENLFFYCKIKDFQVFQLRGMCEENSEIIDKRYVLRLESTLNGRPSWSGFSSNNIQWNKNKTRWELTNRNTNEIIASMKNKAFPVGEGIWALGSNNICIENQDRVILVLSNCGEYEFSCSDGTCIPIQKKCDFVPDCWDKGDELNCRLLNDESMEDYESSIPDIVLDDAGKIVKKTVRLSVTIKGIESIEEVKSRYTMSFNLELEWFDARLTWYDLNEDIDLNIPSARNKEIIWFPKILLANSKHNDKVPFIVPNDSQSKLRVKKMGNLTMSSKESLKESALYHGGENVILYSRQFTEKLKCVFDLSYFPFDTQTCYISFNAGNEERSLIKLVGAHVAFNGRSKLSTFDVIGVELENEDVDDFDVNVKITLKRQISQHLLSMYLPSLFIMAVAQVTNQSWKIFFYVNYTPGHLVLQQGALQDQYSSVNHCHVGHVHSQQLYSFKAPSNINNQVY